MAAPVSFLDLFTEPSWAIRIEQNQAELKELLMTVNEQLQAATAKLDKVYTEVTSVTDDLRAQVEALKASQADPAVVAALEAGIDRLDDLNEDAPAPVEE